MSKIPVACSGVISYLSLFSRINVRVTIDGGIIQGGFEESRANPRKGAGTKCTK